MSDDRPIDAPQADRPPGVVRLYAGMTVAPLAWALHMLIGYSLAAHACFPKDVALGHPVWPGLRTIVVGVTVVAWLLLAAGCLVAWLNWKATSRVSDIGSDRILQTGDGRPRFMALCGVLVSGVFAVALLFTSAGVLWIPNCGP